MRVDRRYSLSLSLSLSFSRLFNVLDVESSRDVHTQTHAHRERDTYIYIYTHINPPSLKDVILPITAHAQRSHIKLVCEVHNEVFASVCIRTLLQLLEQEVKKSLLLSHQPTRLRLNQLAELINHLKIKVSESFIQSYYEERATPVKDAPDLMATLGLHRRSSLR